MNGSAVLLKQIKHAYRSIAIKTACMIMLVLSAAAMLAQTPGGTTPSVDGSRITARHLLGFEGVPNNAKGTLSIQNNVLEFQKGNQPGTQISIDSIQDISLGESDKQVGGLPMTMGKMAVPFGGGRAIGLFSHKKYDTLTLEYVDSNGGLHGAIFQLNKGLAQSLKTALVAQGAHATQADQPALQSTPEAKNETK